MSQERVRALYLQPAPLFGGAERQASIGASMLPEFSVDVILLVGPGILVENWILERKVRQVIHTENFPGGWPRQRGLSVLTLPIRYGACAIRAHKEIAALVAKYKVDIIVASLAFPWVIGALVARRAGIPVIWRAGGARISAAQKAGLWAVSRFIQPDRLLCVSDAVHHTISPLVPAPSVVIRNGIDHGVFHVGAGDRARYRPPGATCVIGFAGRLTRGKHPEDFLELAARVQTMQPHARFLLGGDGARREELEQLARKRGLKNLQFLGFVVDMPSFFAGCDIAVLPSEEEGFPNFALEAMAMGVPLVAADVPANSEVTHGYENAMLYPLGSIDELTHRVNLLIMRQDLCTYYRRRALNWVRQFDAQTSTAKIAELLTAVVAEHLTKVNRLRQVPPTPRRTARAAAPLEIHSHTSNPRILEQGPPSTG